MGIMDKISSLGGKHNDTTPATGSEYGNDSSLRHPVSSSQHNQSSIPGSFEGSSGQGSHLAGHSGSHNTHDPTYQQGTSGLGSHSNTTGLGSHGSALGGNHSGTSGLGSHSNDTTGLGSRTHESGLGSHSGANTGLGSHNTQSGYGSSQYPTSSTSNTTHGLGNQDHVNRDGYGNTSTSGQTTAGPHKSDMLNKLDPRVDSDNSKAGPGHPGLSSTNYGSDGYGQHGNTSHGTQGLVPGSHAENPSAIPTAGGERVGSTDNGPYGSTTSGYPSSHQQSTAGPHNSNLLNKADPRVDSDQSKLRDNNGNQHYGRDAALGGAGVGAGAYGADHSSSHNKDHGLGSHNQTSSSAYPSSHSSQPHSSTHSSQPYSSSTQQDTTAGPHKSNLLNKLDPRVDSDQSKLQKDQDHHYGRDAAIGGAGVGAGAYGADRAHDKHHGQDSNFSRNEPYGTSSTTHTTSSTTAPYSTTGPHNTFAANQLDPHVSSSDRSSHGPGSSSTTSGNTNTAGPHKSDMLNKLDPRVDSDQSKLRDQQSHGTHGTSGRSGVDDITHGTSGMGLGSGTGHSSSHKKQDYGYSAAHQSAYDQGWKDALAHLESQRRH